jgi:hypothetical protein
MVRVERVRTGMDGMIRGICRGYGDFHGMQAGTGSGRMTLRCMGRPLSGGSEW